MKAGQRGTIKAYSNFNAAADVKALRSAIEGIGTTESVVIDTITQRSNAQRQIICKEYKGATGRGKRDESINFNQEQAKIDAKTLYDAGEKKWGTDESKFIDILCKKSIPQLRKTFEEYKILSKTNIVESIKGEMSGNLEDLLVAVVKCVVNTPAYFAERLYKSMKGGGTDEATLSRIMISRSEIDLLDIRAEYKKLFGYSLHSNIKVRDPLSVLNNFNPSARLCGGEAIIRTKVYNLIE
ncbi:UNVERIFIED_CONTAM: hypothetical protein FKN15_076766 [Acipenser sinensis]